MTVGLAAAEANSLLDQLILDYSFIRLHTADPGAAGVTAIAGNATMRDITAAFSPAVGGVATNDVDIDWNEGEVDTTEDYTHFSLWDDAVPTTFGASGTIAANGVNASGDTFSILIGGLTLDFTVAA